MKFAEMCLVDGSGFAEEDGDWITSQCVLRGPGRSEKCACRGQPSSLCFKVHSRGQRSVNQALAAS